MTVSVVGALALATLFPVYATGDWAKPADPWETARASIIGATSLDDSDFAIDPDSITMLEKTPDGGFAFAALSQDGLLSGGIADETGYMLCSVGEPEDEPEVDCSGWAARDTWQYHLWVQRSPDAPSGYRHRLTWERPEIVDGVHQGGELDVVRAS